MYSVNFVPGKNNTGDDPRTPHYHSIDDRPVCSLRFADDIHIRYEGSNNDLQDLTNPRVASVRSYSKEVCTERCMIMVNNRNNISANIVMNGELLEEVSNFKYGSSHSGDGDT